VLCGGLGDLLPSCKCDPKARKKAGFFIAIRRFLKRSFKWTGRFLQALNEHWPSRARRWNYQDTFVLGSPGSWSVVGAASHIHDMPRFEHAESAKENSVHVLRGGSTAADGVKK
jgi:hypothetical protein